jgi:hypothetical protein
MDAMAAHRLCHDRGDLPLFSDGMADHHQRQASRRMQDDPIQDDPSKFLA